MRTIGLAGGIFLAAAATAVMAHTGATGVVKDRMTGMKDMGESVKTISAMMRGEAPLDPDRIREEAEKIKGHAGETLTSLFPEGSTGAPSEAKETIWKRWEEFTALANDLENAAGGLALAAANPPMAQSGGGMMGGASMMGGGGMMDATSMMGGGMMGGTHMQMSAEEIGQMPVDGAFHMLTQTCSACHTRFRAEDE